MGDRILGEVLDREVRRMNRQDKEFDRKYILESVCANFLYYFQIASIGKMWYNKYEKKESEMC